MRRNPSQATSETYNMNMYTFDNGPAEEFLALLRKFKIMIDRPAQLHQQARLPIAVQCYVEKALGIFMNYHFRRTQPTTTSTTPQRV